MLPFTMSPTFNIESYTAAISGIAGVLALDIIVVAARFYTRTALKRKLNLNDWFTIPALVR